MKRILIINASLIFLLSGNSFASPVTLTNLLSIQGNGFMISYDDRENVSGFSSGHGYTTPDALDNGFLYRLSSEDAYQSTDLNQAADKRTDSYYHNVYIDNECLVVKLLSLDDRYFIDNSGLSVAYDSVSELRPAPVPEPSSMLLFGIVFTMSGILIRRKLSKGI
jgi:hypothetical protein